MKLKVRLIPRLLRIVPLALGPLTGAAAPVATADTAPTAFVATNGASDGSLGEFTPAMITADEPATRWIASASSLLGPTALALLGLVLALLGIRRKRRP
jgi:hypothetical protein